MNAIRLDKNSAHLSLQPSYSFEEYVDRVRKCGVVPVELLRSVLEERNYGEMASEDAVTELASALIRKGHLTPWQQQMLMLEQPPSFFFGRYKLLDQLGSGGMGKVYLAEHVLMRRQVALKVLTKTEEDNDRLDRFLLECRAAATLDHPNVVRIHHLDHENGVPYMVMEYMPGEDLKRRVQRLGPLPWNEVADVIRQAAQGLEAIHRAGLVHRDIKPANLMIDPQGTVKLMDLGLALMARPDETSLTKDHVILGTVDYISPEQVRNSHQVDGRADFYSLGATLYFLLSGNPPFRNCDLMERLHKHLHSPPPPLKDERPDAPQSLIDLCERMMAKKPEDRPQTAREIYCALDLLLMGDSVRVLPVEFDSSADQSSELNILLQPTGEFSGSQQVSGLSSLLMQAGGFPEFNPADSEIDGLTRHNIKHEALTRLASVSAHRFNNFLQCILG